MTRVTLVISNDLELKFLSNQISGIFGFGSTNSVGQAQEPPKVVVEIGPKGCNYNEELVLPLVRFQSDEPWHSVLLFANPVCFAEQKNVQKRQKQKSSGQTD